MTSPFASKPSGKVSVEESNKLHGARKERDENNRVKVALQIFVIITAIAAILGVLYVAIELWTYLPWINTAIDAVSSVS